MFTKIAGSITAPQGFKAAGVKAGIKKSGKHDLAVIYSTKQAVAAGVFTLNTMAAAPVEVSRKVAAAGRAAAIVVNAGCANACTGAQGLADAYEMAAETGKLLGIAPDDVFVASTGIIGVSMPMDKVKAGIGQAVGQLSEAGGDLAAQAILTTDTFVKECAYEFVLDGMPVKIGGIAKGSGMIHPNMATMLCFITTDAAISAPLLQQALTAAVNVSFNMISVDGDTSTNDMVAVLANGAAGNAIIDQQDEQFALFAQALRHVCTQLAKLVARDGEGASKFLEIAVRGAADFADAKLAAMAIAKSPLVKTAFFGQDANWGRIICAVGYSGAQTVREKTAMLIGGISIVQHGMGISYDQEALKAVMAEHDITVVVDLGIGDAEATVWSCDLSYEYVKINGEYHT